MRHPTIAVECVRSNIEFCYFNCDNTVTYGECDWSITDFDGERISAEGRMVNITFGDGAHQKIGWFNKTFTNCGYLLSFYILYC